MDLYQTTFINKAVLMATQGKHVFPKMAAAEAALESGYGVSSLAITDNNLFGMKQHTHPIYGTAVLPTKEFLNGEWETVNASWVKYPTWAECFADRMSTLTRLAPYYPHYMAALAATDPLTYINQVSLTWSTGPTRAAAVTKVYQEAFQA